MSKRLPFAAALVLMVTFFSRWLRHGDQPIPRSKQPKTLHALNTHSVVSSTAIWDNEHYSQKHIQSTRHRWTRPYPRPRLIDLPTEAFWINVAKGTPYLHLLFGPYDCDHVILVAMESRQLFRFTELIIPTRGDLCGKADNGAEEAL